MNTTKSTLALVATLMLINTNEAYAYIDPATGSLLLQGLIAAIAGISVTLKLYWHKIKVFFGGKEKTEEKNQEKEIVGDDNDS